MTPSNLFLSVDQVFQTVEFCLECDCDVTGTESCDKATGQCLCKPNVIGDRCDACAADTWGFDSGNGCSFCNCSIASTDSQCDNVTGNAALAISELTASVTLFLLFYCLGYRKQECAPASQE